MLQKDVTVPGEMDVSSLPFKEGDSQLLLQTPVVRERAGWAIWRASAALVRCSIFAAFRKYSREVKFNFMAAS